MAKKSTKQRRWEFLDSLLSEGRPLSTLDIYRSYYHSDDPGIKIIDKPIESLSPDKQEEKLVQAYKETLRKDLDIFKKALQHYGKQDLLVVGRGAYEREPGIVDKRTKTYCYSEKGFSIIPFLNYEMSDADYNRLVKAVGKLGESINEQNYSELKFAIQSRVEADYDKGTNCVDYEDNRRLKGREFRPIIYNAIINKQILEITYEKFTGERFTCAVHPYLLKQYNERWFLFCFFPEAGISHFNLPLDRIVDTPKAVGHYVEDIPSDYRDYFKDIVGVTRLSGVEPRKIYIGVSDINTWGRVISKPLKTLAVESVYDKEKDYGRVSMTVIPNMEFYMKILSLGEHVAIESEPERTEMSSIIQRILNEYK